MDYGKLDAPLAAEVDAPGLEPTERRLLVILRLAHPPNAAEQEVLRGAGVDDAGAGRTIVTGSLSRQQVETLSGQPWVLSLALSSKRRPTW
ncbi:hypothetical protein ACF05T_26410 [Streptomyces lateritius]|uniref:Uncharacterized protein n=1 Tax=Streptomyces lateritius TaxID=67313 RepID=A0ABW6YJH3_9ACTN